MKAKGLGPSWNNVRDGTEANTKLLYAVRLAVSSFENWLS